MGERDAMRLLQDDRAPAQDRSGFVGRVRRRQGVHRPDVGSVPRDAGRVGGRNPAGRSILNAWISDDEHDFLRADAVRLRCTVTEALRRILRAEMERREGLPKFKPEGWR